MYVLTFERPWNHRQATSNPTIASSKRNIKFLSEMIKNFSCGVLDASDSTIFRNFFSLDHRTFEELRKVAESKVSRTLQEKSLAASDGSLKFPLKLYQTIDESRWNVDAFGCFNFRNIIFLRSVWYVRTIRKKRKKGRARSRRRKERLERKKGVESRSVQMQLTVYNETNREFRTLAKVLP